MHLVPFESIDIVLYNQSVQKEQGSSEISDGFMEKVFRKTTSGLKLQWFADLVLPGTRLWGNL